VPKLLHSSLDYVTAHECSSMMMLLSRLLLVLDNHFLEIFANQFIQVSL
jgi:hypothetical protein